MSFFPRSIVSSFGSVKSGLCSLLVLSTSESVHLGFFLLGFCPLWSRATWHSAHVGLFPLLALSTLDSADVWFCLLRSQSTWVNVYLESVHSEVCAHDELLTKKGVHHLFCQFWILLTLGSVFLGDSPPGWMSTWNLSTWKSGIMSFFPRSIVSSFGSVKSGLCSLLVLSTSESVHLGFFLLGFCPLWSLATWHSAHVGLFPLLALSTLDSADVWFCLLRSRSTWVNVYLESVHSEVCAHDEL